MATETMEGVPMSEREIRIDFNRAGRAVEVVDRWELFHPEKSWGIGVFRRRRAVKIHVRRLWVEAQLPACLQVKGQATPVTLEPRLSTGSGSGTASGRSAALCNFDVQAFSFPYDIVLDSASIEDVVDQGVSSAELTVRVGSEWKGQPPQVQSFRVRLQLVRADAVPVHAIVLEPEFVKGYEHRRARVRLGTFWVENAVPVRYAHPLDCTAHVRSEAWPAPGAVSFGPAHEAEGDVRVPRGTGGLVPTDTEVARAVAVGADGALSIRGLAPGARVGVPLYVDMERIPNPDEVAEPTAAVAVEYEVAGQRLSRPDCQAVYRVRRDRRSTALLAVLRAGGEEWPLGPGARVALDEPVHWNPARAGVLECFALRLGNSAESGDGCVEIHGLVFDFGDAGTAIRWKAGAFFRVGGEPADRLDPDHRFPNGVAAFRELAVALRHSDVEAVPGDVAPVRCTVSFAWREITGEGEEPEWRDFRAEVLFRVERDLGPEWLAVDFGTSAIVVSRNVGGVGKVPLVDLQAPLLLRLAKEDRRADEIAEFGTPFISSALRLRAGKSLGAPGRADSLVELAPIRRDLHASPYRLPYLKALIGTTYLPDVAGALQSLTYRESAGGPELDWAGHPLRTDAVVRETYARLLADFVAPAMSGPAPHKVVFTVPNSFTPRHVDQLRSLVTERFPHFRREYVSFISESDAVACFYLANWTRMNERRPEPLRETLRGGDEHVLVYDMGAGTLDLTYLRIRSDAAGNRSVTILGRMGRSTAGNYLDFLIAREIWTEHGTLFRAAMFGPAPFEGILELRDDFKQWVQCEVKQALDRDGVVAVPSALLKSDAPPAEVDLATLRRSSAISGFLQACTADTLDNFFALFSSPEGRPYRRGSLSLDTVVLSGRSMQLELLRRSVEAELKEWTGGSAVHLVDDLDARTLKSAVVQGALQFAAVYRRRTAQARVRIHNRNLQARYGVLYDDPFDSGRLLFKELLNPSTRPLSPDPGVEDGITIYRYDTDVYDADPTNDGRPNHVDLSGTSEAWFVQSFAADTAAHANRGEYEYITRMAQFTAEQVGFGARADRVPVRVMVDEKNQMVVRLGQQTDDPVTPLRMNLHNSATFRAGMWPFLPGEE
jgi:hypothetical protein